eukprot:3194063-Pyramimonas_sp.AAC.1
MTPSQANQLQTWVFHPQHSRHYEVDFKALVDPTPAPEEETAPWKIENEVTGQLLLEKPRIDFDKAAVKRQAWSRFYSTKQRDIAT